MNEPALNKLISMLARGDGDAARQYVSRFRLDEREPMKVRAAVAAHVLPEFMAVFERIAPWLTSTETNDTPSRIRRALLEAGSDGLSLSELGAKLHRVRPRVRYEALKAMSSTGEVVVARERTGGRAIACFRLAEFAAKSNSAETWINWPEPPPVAPSPKKVVEDIPTKIRRALRKAGPVGLKLSEFASNRRPALEVLVQAGEVRIAWETTLGGGRPAKRYRLAEFAAVPNPSETSGQSCPRASSPDRNSVGDTPTRILHALRKAGPAGLKFSEFPPFLRGVPNVLRRQALDDLVQTSEVNMEWQTTAKGGRPTPRYRLPEFAAVAEAFFPKPDDGSRSRDTSDALTGPQNQSELENPL